MEYVTLGLSILSITFVILSFFVNRKDKAEKDARDNARDSSKELIDIEVFKVQLSNVQENVKEMKDDIRDIKQIFITYKDDMRDVAKEVVQETVQLEIQRHVEKFHTKEK